MSYCTMIFLTGLSGAGKSTIAEALQKGLKESEVIDGDQLRKTFGDDLPPGISGREENIRRLIEQTINLSNSKKYVVSAFVSPDASLRGRVKKEVEEKGVQFIEVYIKASIETCQTRDVKGLYARFRKGEDIKLAGITESYQAPQYPAIICDTNRYTVQENVIQILDFLRRGC